MSSTSTFCLAAELCGLPRGAFRDFWKPRKRPPPAHHSEVGQFCQSIIEEMEDSFPRLILADWFQERGDLRGELIRVECELKTVKEECDIKHGTKANEWYILYSHLKDRQDALRTQLDYGPPTKKKLSLYYAKRCLGCGRGNYEHAEVCRAGCDLSHMGRGQKFVRIKGRAERFQCFHATIRVYGVPSWKWLCVKCGGMCR